MSQFYQGVTAGSLPPSVPTSITGDDDSIAVPVDNNINILGDSSPEDNINGITTIANPDGSDDFFITLTNRITGSVTTTDASLTTLVSFDEVIAGNYSFSFDVSAFNVTDSLGASYQIFGGVVSDGITAIKLNLEDKIVNEQAGMTACNVFINISGSSVLLQVQGLAGKTINWRCVGNYVYVGA